MTDIYFPLFNLEKVENPSQLTISRALVLHGACARHRDFEVVQLLKHKDGNLECIIVDVECDGVPSNNPYGIEYRERLALCVPQNRRELVEVLALRKNFPILMHQNSVGFDAPPSLCLYFEPADSVSRTWTPERFLRRIQWWLEKASRGELHPSDQPVEQLFFVAPYELVLPWNFDALKSLPNQRFTIVRSETRPSGGETLFLLPISTGSESKSGITPIEITLPTVVHGRVEREPSTLYELAALFEKRESNLVAGLKDQILQRVSEDGVFENADESITIILVQVPISRSVDSSHEKVSLRAFALMIGALKLGEKLGVLIKHNHRYYKDVLREHALPKAEWHEEKISPLEVLNSLDAASARKQSGIKDEGPEGVIVGVGSLGGTMLELWGRSGWGKWTAIDKDHIKPHNLARHVAFYQHIGVPKTDVVASLFAAMTNNASKVDTVCADATLLNEETVKALKSAKLVIDASTTLEYPRIASKHDEFGRHISVFITPDGNAAVLLAEDKAKTVRLRTLEAQYYRSVIQEPWGEEHLDGNLGTFWSGASCRDISTVLPYSRIMAHAAMLAEQVQLMSIRPESTIRVWSRNSEVGSVEAYEVPVHSERCLRFDELDLFIDNGLEQKLRIQRQQNLPHETGGVLLGYYDFNTGAIVVVDVLPAPADSMSALGSFERGVKSLPELVAEASRRTAGIVQYIGEWHSHPRGHSATPSSDDMYQLAYLSIGMAQDGLPAVSLIIGERDMRVMKGMVQG